MITIDVDLDYVSRLLVYRLNRIDVFYWNVEYLSRIYTCVRVRSEHDPVRQLYIALLEARLVSEKM